MKHELHRCIISSLGYGRVKGGHKIERGDDEWAVLPEDDPKIKLYDMVTPIWCQVSHEWLEENAAQGFGLGFASGFMAGVLMSVLRPEWAVGYHASVRRYYLANDLTPEDLEVWERYAEETAQALPLRSVVTSSRDRPSISPEREQIEDFK